MGRFLCTIATLALTALQIASTTASDPATTPYTTFSIPSTPASLDTRLHRFSAWLSDQQVKLQSVDITREPSSAGGGLGLRATRALSAREVFASIPLKSLISIEHVFQDPWAQEYLDPLTDTEAMSLYIARIRKRGDSPWNEYIQLLPDSFPSSPLFYTSNENALLQSSSVLEYAKRRNARAQQTYDTLDAVVKEELSLDEFKWGLSVLWSRTHGVRVKDSEGKWQKAACFVPVADLLNMPVSRSTIPAHSAVPADDEAGKEQADADEMRRREQAGEEANTECATNAASTHFECFTTRAVSQGAELLVPYGKAASTGERGPNGQQPNGLGNGQLLLDYGFSLEHNQFDVTQVTLPALRAKGTYVAADAQAKPVLAITPQVYSLQEELLGLQTPARKIAEANHTFPLAYPTVSQMSSTDVDSLPPRLVQFARIWVLDTNTLEKLGAEKVRERAKAGKIISQVNERKAMSFLQGHLLSTVKSYGTSAAEDKKLLAEMPRMDDDDVDAETGVVKPHALGNLVKRAILNVRIGEKRILYIYTSLIAQYQKNMEDKRAAKRALKTKASGSHEEL